MSNIQIQSQSAQIAINTTNAKLEVVSSSRLQLRIKTRPARMSVRSFRSKFQVRHQVTYAHLGIATLAGLAKNCYENAYAKTIEAIGMIAQRGSDLLLVGRGRNPTIEQAAFEKKFDRPNHIPIPIERINIEWDIRAPHIEWERGSVDISWVRDGEERAHYTPGSVQISMMRYPQVKISYQANDRHIRESSDKHQVDHKI